MTKDIIFDFFGTLVGYSPDLCLQGTDKTVNNLVNNGFQISKDMFDAAWERCFETLETEAQKTLQEYHMFDVASLFFKNQFGSVPSQKILEGFVETFVDEWNQGTTYLKGITAFLEDLSCQYRLSITSNTHYPPLIQRNLKAMDIEKYFPLVVTSIEFGKRKPSPEIFRHALDKLNIKPSEAVFVGDNYKDDYMGATAVGLKCFLIDTKNQFPLEKDRLDHLFDLKKRVYVS